MNMHEHWAATLLHPERPPPPGLETWNGSDAAHRFAVYRNNVTVSLVDSLAETFGVVQALVGDEFFRAMAAEYVRRDPPQSAVLYHYGHRFAAFIERFPPAQSLPYLPDVARLEYACQVALHAADATPLAPQALAPLLATERDLAQLRIALVPSFIPLASPYSVASIWIAHQSAAAAVTFQSDAPVAAWVQRHELSVRVLPVTTGAFVFSESLRNGSSLGAAAVAAQRADPTFDLASTLSELMARGAVLACRFDSD